MNDYILIAVPAWIYWLLVAYMVIDGAKTLVSLFNQYLKYRINKQS